MLSRSDRGITAILTTHDMNDIEALAQRILLIDKGQKLYDTDLSAIKSQYLIYPLFSVVGEFLSGLVIPIPLMPIWLKNLLMFLPFRYTADLPLRIYSGNVGLNEAVFGIGIQLIWLIMLPIVGNHLMNKAMKHLVVQGG